MLRTPIALSALSPPHCRVFSKAIQDPLQGLHCRVERRPGGITFAPNLRLACNGLRSPGEMLSTAMNALNASPFMWLLIRVQILPLVAWL